MTGFEVQPGELSQLAGGLARFTDVGTDAQRQFETLRADQTGHAGLAAAARDFAEQWEYSLTTIGENAASIADRLHGAAGSYRATEAGIVDAATARR